MFREREIIGLINGLGKKLNDLCSRPDGKILEKLADIESICQEIEGKLDDVRNECLRDDEEFRFQIKEAMKEYWEMKPKAKKETKKKVKKK